MKALSSRMITIALVGAAAATAGIPGLKAQPSPSVKRAVLLRQDTAIPGREVVMGTVELPPGSTEGKHTHFAELYGFVQEGTITLAVEGQPTKTLNPGDVFTVASGRVHEGSNKGNTTAKTSVVFLAEKGKPLTTPVQ